MFKTLSLALGKWQQFSPVHFSTQKAYLLPKGEILSMGEDNLCCEHVYSFKHEIQYTIYSSVHPIFFLVCVSGHGEAPWGCEYAYMGLSIFSKQAVFFLGCV